MILVGNQRGGAGDLARHLIKDENDHVHIHEITGFVANDLMGAFKESEALAKGTRCRQHLFSLSLNPPEGERCSTQDFEQAINEAEARLDLTGQPRAIVFHEKEGRRHAHAVWSRIDTDKMKAIQLSHSKTKLAALSKQLYLDHGWRMPSGHIDKSLRDPFNFTLEEWQQAKRTEQDPREIKEAFRDAWAAHLNGADLADSLRQRGYELAQGNRRAVVAVDRFGEVYSVPRQIGIETKLVKATVEGQQLQTVEQAKEKMENRTREQLDGFVNEIDRKTDALREEYKVEQDALQNIQRNERQSLIAFQCDRGASEARVRQSRFRKGLQGAWDVLKGEHWRIMVQNRREAATCIKRDLAEFEAQIEKHRDERLALRRKELELKRSIKRQQAQRYNLTNEIGKVTRDQTKSTEKNKGLSR